MELEEIIRYTISAVGAPIAIYISNELFTLYNRRVLRLELRKAAKKRGLSDNKELINKVIELQSKVKMDEEVLSCNREDGILAYIPWVDTFRIAYVLNKFMRYSFNSHPNFVRVFIYPQDGNYNVKAQLVYNQGTKTGNFTLDANKRPELYEAIGFLREMRYRVGVID